tara:strand:+ start:76908 stop:77885 length:978 start_codon:yes stop_codon:yes gene_type:complete
MIVTSKFIPAKGLAGCHRQTVLPSILNPKVDFVPERERLIMPDGDAVEFDWVNEVGDGPIVIMLHGMAGSIESSYIRGLTRQLIAHNWRGLMMYYRGHGEDSTVSDRSYHLGDTLPLNTLVFDLHKRFPNTPLFLIGFSMGGNVTLKWLGEAGKNAPITAAVAVSTPFDLRMSAHHIRYGSGKFYQWYLLSELHDHLKDKYKDKEAPFDFDEVGKSASFWEFDDKVTAPINGFKDAADYYDQSSSRQFMRNIAVPTLCINALDDPFMPPEVIPDEYEISEHITIEVSEHGGHVGFVSGTWHHPEFWLERRIPEFIAQHLEPVSHA